MALPNPKKKRRYNLKRQLKRKLRKIVFMLIVAIISATFYGGTRYYGKFYNNELIKEKLNKSGDYSNKKPKQ